MGGKGTRENGNDATAEIRRNGVGIHDVDGSSAIRHRVIRKNKKDGKGESRDKATGTADIGD